tara:strand:+ start:1151 stop:2317 length:1167 start_codon:yes stop_codon:yes gene_type:complete
MSDEDVLFEVLESHLDTGMRGIPVGTCRTSFVDPIDGVHYAGYPIADLANIDPEDAAFLLFNKKMPSGNESTEWKENLAHRAEIPSGALDIFDSIGIGQGHPMDWLSMGIMSLARAESENDILSDAMNLIAWMPELMARLFMSRGGRGGLANPSNPSLGMSGNFVSMLGMEGEDAVRAERILRSFLVLHMDHGGGNLSTFAGKAVASSRSSLFASIASAMNALSGPLHGRANQSCLEFVQKVGSSDPAEVEAFVRGELAAKRPIFGFGHAVLRAEDPRATVQIKIGEEVCPEDPLFAIVRTLREVAPKVLSENPKISNPNANVDLVSGTLLHNAGFRKPDYYTTFFGWARVIGISAQIVDERNSRDGKGVPIYRPKYIARDQPVRRLD